MIRLNMNVFFTLFALTLTSTSASGQEEDSSVGAQPKDTPEYWILDAKSKIKADLEEKGITQEDIEKTKKYLAIREEMLQMFETSQEIFSKVFILNDELMMPPGQKPEGERIKITEEIAKLFSENEILQQNIDEKIVQLNKYSEDEDFTKNKNTITDVMVAHGKEAQRQLVDLQYFDLAEHIDFLTPTLTEEDQIQIQVGTELMLEVLLVNQLTSEAEDLAAKAKAKLKPIEDQQSEIEHEIREITYQREKMEQELNADANKIFELNSKFNALITRKNIVDSSLKEVRQLQKTADKKITEARAALSNYIELRNKRLEELRNERSKEDKEGFLPSQKEPIASTIYENGVQSTFSSLLKTGTTDNSGTAICVYGDKC